MKTVYLGLGSNVGDRARQLQRATDQLNTSDVKITRSSPIYETEPQGKLDQKWFLNVVIEAQTLLFPMQLLARIQGIETALKRKRTVPDGPRTIDIDILFFGDLVVTTAELQIPHPRYGMRRFVLAPLADLAPDLVDPASGLTVQSQLTNLEGQDIRRSMRTLKLH